MKIKKVLFTVLPIFVTAFNIAVIATLVYFFYTHRIVIDDFNQRDTQESFREMREQRPEIHLKYKDDIRELNDKNRDLRLTFMSELASEDPDYNKLQDLNEQIQEVTKDISLTFYNEMIETRKTLTYEEAKKYYGFHYRMMQERFNHDKRRHEMGLGHHGEEGLNPNPRQGRMRRKYEIQEDE